MESGRPRAALGRLTQTLAMAPMAGTGCVTIRMLFEPGMPTELTHLHSRRSPFPYKMTRTNEDTSLHISSQNEHNMTAVS